MPSPGQQRARGPHTCSPGAQHRLVHSLDSAFPPPGPAPVPEAAPGPAPGQEQEAEAGGSIASGSSSLLLAVAALWGVPGPAEAGWTRSETRLN